MPDTTDMGVRARLALLKAEGYGTAYMVRGDQAMLARAVTAARTLVRLTPRGSANRPRHLMRLGDLLSMTFDVTQLPAVLDESIGVLREAVELAPPGHPAACSVRAALARALSNGFSSGGPPEQLDEAIGLLEEATAGDGGLNEEELTVALSNLAQAYNLRFVRDGDRDDLHLAAARLRRALALTARDDPRFVRRNGDLVGTLVQLLDEPGVLEELQEALEIVRRYLPALPGPMQREVMLTVGPLLTTDPATIDTSQYAEMLALGRQFANALRTGDLKGPELRATMLSSGAGMNYQAVLESGDLRQLDQAIQNFRAALEELPDGSSQRAPLLAALGGALGQRIEWTGEDEGLDELLTVLRESVAALPPDSAEYGPYLSQVGNALRLKHALHGGDRLLDEVVETFRTAVERTADDHPGQPVALTNLGTALVERFERWGRPDDLDEAVRRHQAAVAATDEQNTFRPICLGNLGGALTGRFLRTGAVADLDEAIASLREALRLTSSGHPDRGSRLAALANALRVRFQQFGQTSAYDEAVRLLREAAEVTPPGAVQRPMVLDNLGVTLMLGETTEALNEAVRVLTEARDSAPPSSGVRRRTSTNLADALLIRLFQRQEDEQDLEIRKLAMLGAAGLVELDTLAEAARRFATSAGQERLGELDEIVALLEQTLRESPTEAADRATIVSLLGTVLGVRSELSGRAADLDRAERLLRTAVAESPPDSPSMAVACEMLARRLAERGRDHPGRRVEAAELFRRAVAIESAAPVWRARVAKAWADFAAEVFAPAPAAAAHATAVGLLDSAAWRGLDRADQERLLTDFQGLATNAAACAIAAGKPELAVELLEQGRGVLLAQVIDASPDRRELEGTAPELAARLAEIQDALDRTAPGPEEIDETDYLDRRHVLARQRTEVLAEIRALDGFADFLLPPPFARLREAARDGAVVIVNVSPLGCAALVVTLEGVRTVPLPGLTAAEVDEASDAFVRAVEAYARDEDADESDIVPETIAWLDERLGAPIRAAVHAPRLWWCPTGSLALLPLHVLTMDVAVSSYTPTLRTLLHARTGGTTDGLPLLVAMPETSGEADLPGTEREVAIVRDMVERARTLVGPAATRQAVLDALPSSSWVHFACHATQDPAAPSEGRLLLHDGPLTIREIAGLQRAQAQFAFLSGCETARGADVLADECITLAATVQLAGFTHVIGTLWPVSDLDTPRLVKDVYEALADGEKPAAALHHAVVRLRDRYPGSPLLWAPFTHIGP